MSTVMTAYPKNNKKMYLTRVKQHREADELVRRATGQGGRGCAVWCTLNKYDHAAYETELGVPIQLARLEDWLFEHLPEGHLEWPERFLNAIKPGADLTAVYGQWCVRLLTRRLESLAKKENKEKWYTDVVGVVTEIRDRFNNTATGEPSPNLTARAARAAWAAWVAEAAGAARAARAAEAAWAAGAAEAAWAAWVAEAAGAAGAAEIRQQANDLIELIEAAPVPIAK